VAAIQFEPTLFSKTANLEALLRLTEEAAAGGAKLIVTPEMATTAYCWATREEIASDVEPVPGPTTEHFAAIAARHNCWIVVGLPEVDPETDVFYNSAVLIGPEGHWGCTARPTRISPSRSGPRMGISVYPSSRRLLAASP
jgi:predicted amidohydrolase